MANERNVFIINAESGCEAAKNIYSLKKYNFKKNAHNDGGSFYIDHNDTTNNFYNYFFSTTEALNFIAHNGFELISTYVEIFSGYDTQKGTTGDFPITTLSSGSVFCFKK